MANTLASTYNKGQVYPKGCVKSHVILTKPNWNKSLIIYIYIVHTPNPTPSSYLIPAGWEPSQMNRHTPTRIHVMAAFRGCWPGTSRQQYDVLIQATTNKSLASKLLKYHKYPVFGQPCIIQNYSLMLNVLKRPPYSLWHDYRSSI